MSFNVSAGDVYAHFTYTTDGNRTVCFNSSTTSTTDQVKSHIWDFGDGSESNRSNPCHQYDFWSPDRVFMVSLTVIDDDGVEDTYYGRVKASNITIYIAISIILICGVIVVMADRKEIKRRMHG
jgi:PKD repeat protein